MVRIYNDSTPEPKKDITLRLIHGSGGNETTLLVAVDDTGKRVASLLSINGGIVTACSMAKQRLDENGYDTSALPWNPAGSLKISP